MQLSWAYQVHKHTGGKILILAPLAVADQTKREAEKFGYSAKVVDCQENCVDGINITNYEKLDRFVAKEFVGIVLDESSILKSYSGKVRTAIIQNFMIFRISWLARLLRHLMTIWNLEIIQSFAEL